MGSRSLQDDLMQIPGVEGAEVEGSGDRPAGLRIRIAEGADQHAVGSAIRRVLTEHGLGTDTRLPGEESAAAASTEVEADTQAETETETTPAPVAVMTDEDDQDEEAAVIDLTDHATADEEPPEVDDEADVEGPDDQEMPAPEPEATDEPVFPEPFAARGPRRDRSHAAVPIPLPTCPTGSTSRSPHR